MRAALLLTLALPGAATAQALGGRVVDAATKRPLARVAVLVRVDTLLARAETHKDGTFTLPLPRAGRFRLELYPDAGAPFVTDSIDVGPDAFVQSEFAVAPRPDHVYLEFQVDRPAVPRAGSRGPRYPDELRRRGVPGEVVARYVVDSTGRMRPGTFEAVEESDPAFTAAVVAAVREMRYVPAERDGRPVAQVVQHPFRFSVRGGTGNIVIGVPQGVRVP